MAPFEVEPYGCRSPTTMTLLTCTDCGHAVSDLAVACPGCGRPAAHLRPIPVTQFGAPSVVPAPSLRPVRVAPAKTPDVVAWMLARPAAMVACGCIAVTLAILYVALRVRADNAAKAEQAQRDRELAAENAETDRRNEKIRADKAKEDAEKVRLRDSTTAQIKSDSSKMARPQRDEWIRACVEKGSEGGCHQWQVDAMIAGVIDEKERLRAERVSFAEAAERTARTNGEDGSTKSVVPLGMIAGLVARPNLGLPMLDLVHGTTLADAKKDPDEARGKRIRVGGNIIEIHASGGGAEGALMTDGLTVVRFYTGMSTDGIYDGGWATFVGVFIQEYDYANVSGGETRSYLLAGAFDIAANHL